MASVLVALMANESVAARRKSATEDGTLAFCDLEPEYASYDDVEAAYQAYTESLEDNPKLVNLVRSSHEEFLNKAGRSRAGKQYTTKHASIICSMREVLADVVEVAS